jgi:hypothetical protein
MRDYPKHNLRPEGLIVHGHALSVQGNFQEAEAAYHDAVTSAYETQRPRHALEAQAGLAQVAFARDDLKLAMNFIEEILAHLETETPPMGHPLDGTMEPLRIYLTCYQVLKANQDPRASEILSEAYNLLQERVANISDDDLRYCFLNNLAANREIVSEYETSGLGER